MIFEGDLLLIPVLLIFISVLFLKVDKNQHRATHYFVSSHGFLLALGHSIALTVWGLEAHHALWFVPFYGCLLASVGALLFSLFQFKGPKSLLLLHLFTLVCLLFVWFVGTMAITNKWL